MKLLADRVAIKQLKADEMSKGGLHIPEPAQEKPQKGIVVVVGPGAVTEDGKTIPMTVKKGDEVLFAKYGGTEVIVDGEEEQIMRESDILAILETEKPESE